MLITHLIFVRVCILQESSPLTRNNLPNVKGLQTKSKRTVIYCVLNELIQILDTFSDVHSTQSSNLAAAEAEQRCVTVDFSDSTFVMCNQFHANVGVRPKKGNFWICSELTREFGLIRVESGICWLFLCA